MCCAHFFPGCCTSVLKAAIIIKPCDPCTHHATHRCRSTQMPPCNFAPPAIVGAGPGCGGRAAGAQPWGHLFLHVRLPTALANRKHGRCAAGSHRSCRDVNGPFTRVPLFRRRNAVVHFDCQVRVAGLLRHPLHRALPWPFSSVIVRGILLICCEAAIAFAASAAPLPWPHACRPPHATNSTAPQLHVPACFLLPAHVADLAKLLFFYLNTRRFLQHGGASAQRGVGGGVRRAHRHLWSGRKRRGRGVSTRACLAPMVNVQGRTLLLDDSGARLACAWWLAPGRVVPRDL